MTVAELRKLLDGFDEGALVVIVSGAGDDVDCGDFRPAGELDEMMFDRGDVGRAEDGFEGQEACVIWPEEGW